MTGEPTGLLKETPAMALVNRIMPQPTRDGAAPRAQAGDRRSAAITASTSVTDAAGNPADFAVLDEARRDGDAAARVYYSLLVTPGLTEAGRRRFDAVWKAHPDADAQDRHRSRCSWTA